MTIIDTATRKRFRELSDEYTGRLGYLRAAILLGERLKDAGKYEEFGLPNAANLPETLEHKKKQLEIIKEIASDIDFIEVVIEHVEAQIKVLESSNEDLETWQSWHDRNSLDITPIMEKLKVSDED